MNLFQNRIFRTLLVLFPVVFVGVFLYMTFFHSAYETPGRIIYYSQCASCHGDKGEGVRNLVPPIRSDYFEANFNLLPCLIKSGINDSILVNGKWYNQPMYPIELSPVELANLMNFLQDSFLTDETKKQLINEQWIQEKLSNCKQ